MSLSKLPDLLKSQICSFLDFQDVKKLEQINKKTQYFLKRYKVDMPKIHSLKFRCDYLYRQDDRVRCCMKLDENGKETWFPEIEIRKDQDIHTSKILRWIMKFNSIDTLEISACTLSFDTLQFPEKPEWKLVKTKFRIGRFVEIGFTCSRETMMNFFARFKRIELKGIRLEPAYINDAFVSVLAENGTSLLVYSTAPMEVVLTDVTLDTLSKTHLPKEIQLSGLVDFWKNQENDRALGSDMTEISWDFGILKKDQYEAVHRFVNKEFKEWALRLNKPLYFEHQEYEPNQEAWRAFDDPEYFTILRRKKQYHQYHFDFAVKKPEDFIQREDSEEEGESEEEHSGEDEELEAEGAEEESVPEDIGSDRKDISGDEASLDA